MKSSGNEGPEPKSALDLRSRLVLAFLALLLLACCIVSLGFLRHWQLPDLFPFNDLGDPRLAIFLIFILGIPFGLILALWVTRPFRVTMRLLDAAVKSFGDGDYSIRLAPPKQPELEKLIGFFNQITQLQQEERGNVYQKELLLDTIIQSAPMGILLVGPGGHVILANRETHQMMKPGEPLLGLKLDALSPLMPPNMQVAMTAGQDALFTLDLEGKTESFHLAQRAFRINTLPYRLIMIKRLTREMRRAEVEVWKKIIRLINHELNNTLGPLQSMLHSARTILKKPEHFPRLDKVFDTMENTCAHLARFLQDYAAFARLPTPRPQKVALKPFLEEISALIPFRFELADNLPDVPFDPAQMQRVLLNLVKNAREAGGPEDQVRVVVTPMPNKDLSFQVLDRGKGMNAEALENALTPFFSTKKQGTGLGLTLCREIVESHGGSIRLQRQEGGGMAVTCTLPGVQASNS